jgi:hypothetical protein
MTSPKIPINSEVSHRDSLSLSVEFNLNPVSTFSPTETKPYLPFELARRRNLPSRELIGNRRELVSIGLAESNASPSTSSERRSITEKIRVVETCVPRAVDGVNRDTRRSTVPTAKN